jgi:hypothetical protein
VTPRSPIKSAVLTDITNTADLLRYAAKAQAAYLKDTRKIDFQDLATATGMTKSAFSGVLNDSSDARREAISNRLHEIDGAVFAFDSDFATRTGGLVALAARLRGYKDEATSVGKLPPVWVSELVDKNFEKPIGFLLQASALLSAFRGARSDQALGNVVDYHQAGLQKVVYPLLMVGAGAPAAHSIDALIVIGALARHRQVFEGVRGQHGARDTLRDTLAESPLGFRVWRAITSVVQAVANAGEPLTPHDSIGGWVKARLQSDSETLRKRSLYPARSLDLELAIAVPIVWTTGRDWATEILERRAHDPKVNLRERGTAAMGIWERALSYSEPLRSTKKMEATAEITKVIGELEQEGMGNDPRPFDSAPPGGREWLISTLRHLIAQDQKVAQTWPDDAKKHPCVRVVAAGSARLRVDPSVPDAVKAATVFLFDQALLQNAGVYRRKAIDTLRGAGLAGATARALISILDRADEPWLRCRALFALGFLQDRDDSVQTALKDAVLKALSSTEQHIAHGSLTRDVISELHAAIFAIGDCYGSAGQERYARYMRGQIDEPLWKFVNQHQEEEFFPVSRAAAYLLTVTPQLDDQNDDRKLLRQLEQTHPDAVTKQACAWALSMRFATDSEGKDAVRPLHLAPPPS